MIPITINGKKVNAMVDTGANVSLVSAAFIQRSMKGEDRPKEEPYMIKVADRYEPIDQEIQMARIGYQGETCIMDIDVMEGMIGSCLLGLDWLDQTGYLIDPRNRTLVERTPMIEQYANRVDKIHTQTIYDKASQSNGQVRQLETGNGKQHFRTNKAYGNTSGISGLRRPLQGRQNRGSTA